jgi:NitT/TauT family transport system permease protein
MSSSSSMPAMSGVSPAPRERADAAGPPGAQADLPVGLASVPDTPSPAASPLAAANSVRGVRWRAAVDRLRANLRTLLLGLISIGTFFTLWYLATKYQVEFYIRFRNIPSPVTVFSEFIDVIQLSQFQKNLLTSVQRIFSGFAIAALLGIILGLLIGRYRLIRGLVLPSLEIVRPIPGIAWVPMSIMLWPTSESSIIFICFLGAFFPILLNTIHGVQTVDRVLLRAAQSLGAREGALLLQIILPAALPHIFTGLGIGMGVAWVSLVAAEMISGQFGIGYFTWEAYSLIHYSHIVIGMLSIGFLGLLSSALVRGAGSLAMPWHRVHVNEGHE